MKVSVKLTNNTCGPNLEYNYDMTVAEAKEMTSEMIKILDHYGMQQIAESAKNMILRQVEESCVVKPVVPEVKVEEPKKKSYLQSKQYKYNPKSFKYFEKEKINKLIWSAKRIFERMHDYSVPMIDLDMAVENLNAALIRCDVITDVRVVDAVADLANVLNLKEYLSDDADDYSYMREFCYQFSHKISRLKDRSGKVESMLNEIKDQIIDALADIRENCLD